mmetsp:Transcript_42494/g.123522  ORF Transcript_42494/g.123522 Transcript_42494/m.123522 type:complete len:216 (-) Transcript_42494:203-850(-)
MCISTSTSTRLNSALVSSWCSRKGFWPIAAARGPWSTKALYTTSLLLRGPLRRSGKVMQTRRTTWLGLAGLLRSPSFSSVRLGLLSGTTAGTMASTCPGHCPGACRVHCPLPGGHASALFVPLALATLATRRLPVFNRSRCRPPGWNRSRNPLRSGAPAPVLIPAQTRVPNGAHWQALGQVRALPTAAPGRIAEGTKVPVPQAGYRKARPCPPQE